MGGREECLVVLAWETGHRVGSLRQLRWSDVDLEGGRIHFRRENDRIGHDHWNPLHAEAVAILKRERARASAIGEAWVFPSVRDARKPLRRHTVQRLWQRLAITAKLPSGERYGWHSFRRAFANRYRRPPLRDLQDLGGWKSSATLMKVYLRSDEAAQREVLTQRPPARRTGTKRTTNWHHCSETLKCRNPAAPWKAKRGHDLRTDRVRFELTVRFHVHTLSRRAP